MTPQGTQGRLGDDCRRPAYSPVFCVVNLTRTMAERACSGKKPDRPQDSQGISGAVFCKRGCSRINENSLLAFGGTGQFNIIACAELIKIQNRRCKAIGIDL